MPNRDAFKGAFDAMIPQSTAEPYSPPAASSQDPVAEDPSAALEAAARLVKEFQIWHWCRPGSPPGDGAFARHSACAGSGSSAEGALQRRPISLHSSHCRRNYPRARSTHTHTPSAGDTLGLGGHGWCQVELARRRVVLAQRGVEPLAAAGVAAAAVSLGKELLDYWTKLGHTISCAVDLRHYARILAEASPEAALQLVSEMDAAWVGAAADAAVQLEPLRRRVAALCLEFCIAEQLKRTETVPETLERCRALMALYTAASKLYEGADPRERGPADELPLLAAQYLTVAQRHFEPGSARLLIQAQLYVAVGLEHSKFNSDLRLATCSLYSLMGASTAALAIFKQLDVKHIQLDTMPQHILPTLLGCGDWEQALDLRSDEHMHRSHSRDAGRASSSLLAYNHGTLATKVPEFVGFKERLHSSHLRAVARTEVEMMNLRKAFIQTGEPADMLEVLAGSCHALPQGDFTKDRMEQLQFNEDLSTHTTWHSPFPSSPMTGLCDWWNGILGAAPSAADPHWMQGDRAVPQPQQQRWRDGIQARFLIPHLLRAAYSLSAPTADKPLLLEEIATNLRVLSTSLNATLGESSGSSGTAGVLAPRGDPVLARTFTLVRDFASLGVGGADGAAIAAGGTNFEAVTSGLKLLQTEVLEVCTALGDNLKKSCEQTISDAGREEKPAGGLPISQGAVAAIGAFLAEPLLCVSMCLQAWTRQLAKSEKRKKKSSSPSAEQTAELKAAVQSLAAALGSSIQSLQANCEAAVSETKPEQMQILLAASGIQIPAGDMMAPEIVDGVLDGIVTGIQTSLKSVSVKLKRLQAVTAASVM
ncbi:hypothetical protein CYMTET_37478 [Cymbomonas tetramitiformis]|uniref:Uncharacterized protein n=1 Tax=Cymbomonas tetramitiformis TaxID=36881 RepID=A0AAE0F5Y3_9CHLO|nr:hypothetical protein CYMTET_37478 [Cymbomonas tetramitiformis]